MWQGNSKPIATVLLVDPDPTVLLVLTAHLRGEGFRVLLARNAAEAMQLVNNPDLLIHVALVGITAPGAAVGEQLIRERPGMRVLFHLTAREDSATRLRVLSRGLGFEGNITQEDGPAEAVRWALVAERHPARLVRTAAD